MTTAGVKIAVVDNTRAEAVGVELGTVTGEIIGNYNKLIILFALLYMHHYNTLYWVSLAVMRTRNEYDLEDILIQTLDGDIGNYW